jgi:streptogramin lyase
MIALMRPGVTFAGYRVEALVGRGGMGVVYRAIDLSLERPVALKLVAPELAMDERFRARFFKEPRLAAALDHPHVIPIYEAGEHEGQLYLAMRYVEGSDLKTLLERDERLSPERALSILAQIGDALDAAHRRGLVHRDVKPANVLLDDDGHAYLTDFGITKQVGGESTDTGRVVGTLDYLAPEQIRGEDVDGRTDCYALACVLYECLAGTPPFRRATEAETLWAHIQEEPTPLPDHPALGPVLDRALAKAREDRPGSCAELIEDAGGALGLAAPPPVGRRLSRGTMLLLVGGLLLAAAAVLALIQALGGDDPADPGAPRFDVATNSVGAVEMKTNKLALAAPLPGRPTDVAAGPETAWIASVDSTAVTGVSTRTRSITRTVPLRGSADAVAVGEGSVWVADGRRGVLWRIEQGYERVAQRIRVPRSAAASGPSGRLRARRASLAVGAGAVWLTNGSRRLVRIDPETGAKRTIAAGRRLDGVATGGGEVWVFSSESATIARVDPRDGNLTDKVSIVARPGADTPFPLAVAATSRFVWVLNGNTATVTQIEPDTLGVVTTIPIGVDRVPTDIAATGATAWVSNADGSLMRIDAGASAAKEIRVGESLERVAADGRTVWVTTTAFDQKLPGGAG